MDSFFEFLALNGYAIYVWPVYGISALALIILSLGIFARTRYHKKMLDSLINDAKKLPRKT